MSNPIHLLSFIGTSKYKNTIYQYQEETCETWYNAAAYLQYAQNQHRDITLTIIGTTEAKQQLYDNQEISKELQRLSLLENTSIDFVIIPRGSNQQEMWTLFQQIITAVNHQPQATEVWIDLTQGYRSQSLLAVGAILYAHQEWKQQEQSPQLSLFYSLFEQPHSQIIDITSLLTAFDWINALNEFERFGSADHLSSLMSQVKTPEQKHPLRGLARNLQSFAVHLRLGRSSKLLQQAKKMANQLTTASGILNSYIPILSTHILNASAWIQQIQAEKVISPKGLQASYTLAKMYKRFGNYHAFLAVLRELSISQYTVENYHPNDIIQPYSKGFKEHRNQIEMQLHKDSRNPAHQFKRQVQEQRNTLMHADLQEHNSIKGIATLENLWINIQHFISHKPQ